MSCRKLLDCSLLWYLYTGEHHGTKCLLYAFYHIDLHTLHIFESTFSLHTQAELRKLTREDKQRCQRIVNECMAQYVHDFSSLGQFQMKLTLAIDEFTSQMTALSPNDDWFADTANPLLEVTKRL